MTTEDKQRLAELARQLIQANNALNKAIDDHQAFIETLHAKANAASSQAGLMMKQLGLSFAYVDGRMIQRVGDESAYAEDESGGFANLD